MPPRWNGDDYESTDYKYFHMCQRCYLCYLYDIVLIFWSVRVNVDSTRDADCHRLGEQRVKYKLMVKSAPDFTRSEYHTSPDVSVPGKELFEYSVNSNGACRTLAME